MSIFIYLLSIALYYVLLVFDQLPIPILQKNIEEKAAALVDEYENKLGGQ